MPKHILPTIQPRCPICGKVPMEPAKSRYTRRKRVIAGSTYGSRRSAMAAKWRGGARYCWHMTDYPGFKERVRREVLAPSLAEPPRPGKRKARKQPRDRRYVR